MRYIFIFLMLCFGCQVFPDIRVRHLPLNGGLSSNMINSIYQDADGMIYFGTASGLNKYDGHSIQTYVNDPADSTSIHDNFVEDIQGFPDGRLLIRAGGTYTLYDPLSDKFNSDISNICHELGVDSYPQSITVDDNDIWCFGRENGIVRFSPKMGVRKVSGIDSCIAEKDLTDLIVSPDHRETYAVTHSGEILIINTSTMTLKEIVKIPDNSTNNLVYTLFMDSDKTIWTFAETGLYAYDRNTKKWIDNFAGTHWPMGKPKAITQDQNGKIWIGYNQEGLAVLDKNGDIEILKNVEDNLSSLPANTVTCLFEDKTGSMWIGTSKKGISIFNQCMYKFEFYKFSDVNCIFATSDGNLLIGTDNNGLFLTDRNYNILNTYHNRAGCDIIVCLLETNDGTIYAGTYSGGVMCIKNGRTSTITTQQGLVSNNVWALSEMDNGNIMIATLGGGLQIMDPKSMEFITFNTQNSGLPSDYVCSMSKDDEGHIYLATSNGIGVFDTSSLTITPFQSTTDKSKSLANLNINQVFVDSRGLVWIATRSGLNVYDPFKDKIYTPDTSPNRAHKFISGITEDRNHSMWISAGGSLTNISIDCSSDTPFFSSRNYNSYDGLQNSDLNQRSFCMLPDGEMLVGGLYGINSFNPDQIIFNTFPPEVILTGLKLFNQDVKVGESYDGKVILPANINSLNEIKLDYSQNEFSIMFSTDDYVLPEKTTYSYILDGFNKDWATLPEGVHQVTYTNLSPGTYTLRVKATNNDGISSASEKTLQIVINPPFYASPWAITIYCLLAASIPLGALLFIKRREKKKYILRIQEEKHQKQEELNQMKFKFFTNISHELRTPLTLITAPLESLISKENDEGKKKKLSIMQTNAVRLLNLVNQLLDFRKNEITGLSFNPSQGNIVAFIRQICDSFLMFSEKKSIRFSFTSSAEEINMVFDEDKMGKIIMNLLSNAFKHTPFNGEVRVNVCAESNILSVTVADTGNGVADEDKSHIFDRFYQASNSVNPISGSGIGLSLVAEYVKLHNGTVAVSDNPGGGALFTVDIPIVQQTEKPSTTHHKTTKTLPPFPPSDKQKHSSLYKILFVDDNRDLIEFISDELGEEYCVRTAENGNEALRIIASFNPDLIVSDIMMPEIDGIELCRILKSDASTASIPLMMLTAKHDVGAKIEGLTLGADDYLTKPFNLEVLKLRINKLLDLKGKGMRRPLIDPEPEKIEITSLDEQLVEKAVRYVEKNMDRSELTVEELSAELGMSRVHLYKRLKQLTGKTPIEFIRVIRLKRAAQLLRESQLNVSEIAYKCGFNNPKYFSKYFKEEFGILPSAYQDAESKETNHTV